MLIDAHTHLDRYRGELDAALDEIARNQILTVGVSMDVQSYQRSREIGERSKFVIPTFGIHPWNAHEYAETLPALDRLIVTSPMIGEIGLDFYWVANASKYPAQLKVFEYFLAAARDQDKVVNLHTKGAERQVLEFLDRYHIERAIVHWYSGPLDILREMIARGIYFTIGVEVRYSAHIQTIAREIPKDQLLTETDNPGGEKWLSGNLGMPGVIGQVIDKLGELREMPRVEIVQTVEENFARLTRDSYKTFGKST